MAKILVLGQGYLGSYLTRHLGADSTPMEPGYDYVINCIAKPNVAWCEQNPTKSFESNVASVVRASVWGEKLIHFSSYYVYDDEGACAEDAPKCADYVYMVHKLASEQWATARGGVVFRLGKLFGNTRRQQGKLTDYILQA